jgi:signal transduction histidine kinase
LLSGCILNLLKNGLEACGEGDAIRVSLTESVRSVTIVIQDTGSGMDEETLANMFVPLFTTKPNGNGLGAFIARTVILRHFGSIHVKSVINSGTMAIIELPRSTK